MSANNEGRSLGSKTRPKVRLIILVTVLGLATVAVAFAYRFVCDWRASEQMATALNNGLEELKGKTSGTIHLANNWGARTVVVCRGYLESSKELSKDLANVGLAKPVASRISESPRWTEGTHFYLVKNQKVLYFHCPRLHMENVNRDFLHATVDEKLYLDVTSTTDFHLAGIR